MKSSKCNVGVNMKFDIRKMTAMDLAGVVAVEHDVFLSPWTQDMFKEEIENKLATYLVVEIAGEIVGYAGFWGVIYEAQITNVAIKQDFQRKGLGHALMKELIEEAKRQNLVRMSLEVRPSNPTARGLYFDFGFEEVGVRPGYYMDNGEAAILMSCEFFKEVQSET